MNLLLLVLSSEDCTQDEVLDDLTSNAPSIDDLKKQGVAHIPVSAEQVLRSDGDERWKWMQAGATELDNPSGTGTTESTSPEAKEQLKAHAKAKGQKYIELPAMAVFTIKPNKHKVRIVACSNTTSETYGRISTTDLDTAMLRYLLWGVFPQVLPLPLLMLPLPFSVLLCPRLEL